MPGPLVRTVSIRQVGGAPCHSDVDRASRAGCRNPAQRPTADQLPAESSGVQVGPARAKRKLVDGIQRDGVANVKLRITPVAGSARSVFNGYALPRAHRGVGDGMRPHILRLPQPSVGERALQRRLQSVEVAVRVVVLHAKLPKLR